MAKSGQHGGNITQMAAQYDCHADDIIDFSANINPFGMPKAVKHAIIKQLDDAEHYPDIDYTQLYTSLAEHYQCQPSQLLIGNGATELIYDWVNHLRPHKAVLVEPSFSEYRRALNAVQCDIVTHYLQEAQDFQLDESILAALTPDIDCLFLCSPNNPTGAVIERSLVLRIVNQAQENQIAVMIDESFIDFIPHQSGLIHDTERFPNLFILRSLTKFFAIPGLRFGLIVSDNDVAMTALRDHQKPWTINCFAAIAGEVAFHDNAYFVQTYEWIQAEQAHLFDALKTLPNIKAWQPTANYIFLKCLDERINLQAELMKQKLLIRSCANYPGLNEQYYRIAIKSRHDNQLLLATLYRLMNRG